MYLRTGFLFLFIIGLVCTNAQESSAQEYTIPVIKIEANVQPDGAIRITEHRTYRFDGSFSWADYRLPLEGFTKITNIQVSEYNTLFINKNNEEPGSFSVGRDDNKIQIKWFYSAEDEERTFTISYTLEGALVVGPKWAEFFWNYISSSREKDTDLLKINWKLPAGVEADSIYIWKRGAGESLSIVQNNNGYTAKAADLDDDEFIKIRAVFPRSVFNNNAISVNDTDFTLDQARAEEKNFRQQQIIRDKREARYAKYGQTLAIIVSLLSIIAFIVVYQKYGKRHAAHGVTSSETIMVPGRLKPAIAGWLLGSRSISSLSLMATLLYLARNKYFIINEQEPEKQWLSGEKKIFTIEKTDLQLNQDLTDWEQSLANFVSDEIDKGNNRVDKLFSESASSSSKWFKKWKEKLKAHCKANNWYDQESYTGVYINLGVQLVFLALAITSVAWARPAGIIPMIITLPMLPASAFIIRRTSKGEKTYRRWKAYKKGLKNAGNYSISTDVLDKHLIYAVAFGLTQKNIETVFEQSESANIAFYWFVFYPESTSSPADMAGTFSMLSASGAAAFPGAAAAGGGAGASAGAAGGGAAGGAG